MVETSQELVAEEGAVEERRVRRRRRRRRSGHGRGAGRRRRRRQQLPVEVEIGRMPVAAAFGWEGRSAAIYRALVHQFQVHLMWQPRIKMNQNPSVNSSVLEST